MVDDQRCEVARQIASRSTRMNASAGLRGRGGQGTFRKFKNCDGVVT
jgi:hypothetical protein